MTTETDARARIATKLKTMTKTLHEIKNQSSYIMDKGDVLGPGGAWSVSAWLRTRRSMPAMLKRGRGPLPDFSPPGEMNARGWVCVTEGPLDGDLYTKVTKPSI